MCTMAAHAVSYQNTPEAYKYGVPLHTSVFDLDFGLWSIAWMISTISIEVFSCLFIISYQ